MELLSRIQTYAIEITELLKDGKPASFHQARLKIHQWHQEEPNGVGPLLYAGILSGLQREHEDALEFFVEASRLAPYEPTVWLNGARAYLALQRYKQSIQWAEKARRVDASGYLTKDGLALQAAAFNELGKFKDSESLGTEMFDHFQFVDESYLISLWVQGRYQEVLGFLANLPFRNHDPSSHKIAQRRVLSHPVESALVPLLALLLEWFQEGVSSQTVLEILPALPQGIEQGSLACALWWGRLEKEDLLRKKQEILHLYRTKLTDGEAQAFLELLESEEPCDALQQAAKEYRRRLLSEDQEKRVLSHG